MDDEAQNDLMDTSTGLSEVEALRLLTQDGPNELQRKPPRPVWRIAFQVIRDPMFLLLLAAGVIYLFLGDWVEALMLLAAVVATAMISIVQEKRTDNVLASLRDLASPRALVIRDGQQKRIAGSQVVCGDVIVLAEGDRIPADAQVLSANNLQVDESLLTGESVAVDKLWVAGEDAPSVFSGSLVVRGHGLAQVFATGINSELGKIGKALGDIPEEPTRLHAQTRQLVKLFGSIGLTLSVLVVLFYGLQRGDWLAGALSGITLAMAILPQEFPLILTFFMAMGAWRISKHQVLTRQSATIETLGSATVLCTDKTGTLTLNRMAVAELRSIGQVGQIAHVWQASADSKTPPPVLPELHELLEYAMLASETRPTDPMERAIMELGGQHLQGTERLHPEWVLAHEYGLSSELLAMTHVWASTSHTSHLIAAKGAPETIIDLCHVSPAFAADLREAVNAMAAEGLRVLGVAKATFIGTEWPAGQHDFDFELVGLLGLADPLRASVPKAVAQCQSAGIRVMMITGDYPVTALAIARQAGIVGAQDDERHVVMAGDELAALSEPELAKRVGQVKVFARIKPAQKLAIVNALKNGGEVVAMTGDGVNDAPALKAAHIGIAMGQRGTDVAREAAAMVLLDDDFGSIVKTIAQGRQIYDNIRKALAFVVSVHVPIAGLVFLTMLLGWPILIFPAHVAFFELVINPICSFVFEAEDAEPELMHGPPRPTDAALFGHQQLFSSTLQGLMLLGSLLALNYGLRQFGIGQDELRAASFVAMMLGSLLLVWLNLKSKKSNGLAHRKPSRAFLLAVFGTGLTLLLINTVPVLQSLFKFATLSPTALGLAFASGLLSYVLVLLVRNFKITKAA
ncbi:MAG: cation-translocating P-type ATPase [Burkholderiaceae bacterium]